MQVVTCDLAWELREFPVPVKTQSTASAGGRCAFKSMHVRCEMMLVTVVLSVVCHGDCLF